MQRDDHVKSCKCIYYKITYLNANMYDKEYDDEINSIVNSLNEIVCYNNKYMYGFELLLIISPKVYHPINHIPIKLVFIFMD